ncbi:MAG: cohesin domain-containing protein [Pleurocapsa sp.]
MMNRLLFSGASLFFLLTAFQSKAMAIDMSLSSPSANLGDKVDVELDISGLGNGIAPSVSAFDVDVTFDPSVISFDSVTFGNQLSLNSTPLFQDGIVTCSGILNLAEISDDTPTDLNDLQAPDFTLATISFNTVSTGSSNLGISLNDLGDAAGDPLTVDNFNAGTVTVAVPFGVSTNMGIMILAGICGVNYLRKKSA